MCLTCSSDTTRHLVRASYHASLSLSPSFPIHLLVPPAPLPLESKIGCGLTHDDGAGRVHATACLCAGVCVVPCLPGLVLALLSAMEDAGSDLSARAVAMHAHLTEPHAHPPSLHVHLPSFRVIPGSYFAHRCSYVLTDARMCSQMPMRACVCSCALMCALCMMVCADMSFCWPIRSDHSKVRGTDRRPRTSRFRSIVRKDAQMHTAEAKPGHHRRSGSVRRGGALDAIEHNAELFYQGF